MRFFQPFAVAAVLICSAIPAFAVEKIPPVHAIAMQGAPKYGADFKHFDYANPNAAKGGSVKLAAIGSFDNLNPFILKGIAATGMGLTFDTLLVSSSDEAFTEYGLLAESIEMPADRSWVIFNLREEAKFHDGSPVTAQDVAFSFETFKTKGTPQFRLYYGGVKDVEILGPLRIKFTFGKGDNRELPLIIGQMQVVSKAYYQKVKFEETTLTAPLGSGPYMVEHVDPGRAIVYKRNPDYWGRDLAVNKGRYNFDSIRYDYYRDGKIALEAFKSGEYDFRLENIAKEWATSYDFPAVHQKLVIKDEIRHESPTGMQGFAMNTRRPLFADPLVREALGYAFDFEWANKALFFGAYTRSQSYFSNSELSASGLPSAEELKILGPFRHLLPEEVFTKAYQAPQTDGSGNIRANLRYAQQLLEQAGWVLENDILVKNGEPFRFEIVSNNPSFERVLLPFKNNLQKLGVEMAIRTMDSAQYQKRIEDFDYDMTVVVVPQSLSPGNEQRNFWSSGAADQKGSDNYMGIKSPVVDALVEKIIAATTREDLIASTRALDRVLLWGHYVIPNWHIRVHRVAYWDKFARPKIEPKYALGFLDNWWIDAEKEKSLAARKLNPEKSLLPHDEGRTRHGLILLAVLAAALFWAYKKNRKKS